MIIDMKNKGVLVTGSGTGIGREIALEFARSGANVAFHYSSSPDGAKSGVKEAQALGVKAEAFQANFAEIDQVLRVADETAKFLGRVDILVNNAGITFNKPFLKTEPAQFDKIYNVNVRASYFLSQKLIPAMIEAGSGAICNITSIHGYVGAIEHAIYAGTKGAIIAQTRTMAMEFAHKNVRINAISPGAVQVENHLKAVPGSSDEAAVKWAYNAIPAGRIGRPIDIARLAVFLCSDEASYIIGQTIISDGGTTSLMSLATDFRTESKSRFGEQYV
jgi:3-oxoacyl-[acyl-carrier protein] reductase